MSRKVIQGFPRLFLSFEPSQYSRKKGKGHGSRIGTKARTPHPIQCLVITLQIEQTEGPIGHHPGEKYIAWTEPHGVIDMGYGVMSALPPKADIFKHRRLRLLVSQSGHRSNILNTLVFSAYRHQSIIEAVRYIAKSHEWWLFVCYFKLTAIGKTLEQSS
ncbi:MAG: hypothetical protein V3R37_11330 [Rhodospirillales bacterium]